MEILVELMDNIMIVDDELMRVDLPGVAGLVKNECYYI